MKKYMIKLYTKCGKLTDTWFTDSLQEAEKIRTEWAEVNGITEFSYMPTIWKHNWKKRGYERILGY